MGNFFKALEQAERDHALREHAKEQRKRTASADVAAVAPPLVREAPPMPPAVSPPAAVATHFQPPIARQLVAPLPPTPRPAETDHPTKVEEHLISLLSPTSFGAEQYRALRHHVERLHAASNLSVVGVTSPEAGDGKTLTALNLAGALAQATDARVLVVDADLRLSSLAGYLGLDRSRGRGLVGAILDPGTSLKDVVEPCPPFNLSVVRAGRRSNAPYELLKSPRLGQLLDEARREYDYVIVDMPPLLPLLDCRVIGRWVDGFFVIVSAHKTPRKLVGEALKVLDPASIIGVVFNADDRAPKGYYGHSQSSGGERGGWWRRRNRRASEPAEGIE
jgi:protein-tyrosine kinase